MTCAARRFAGTQSRRTWPAFGHFHASGAVERHHHAAGDATVVVEDRDLPPPSDADDMSTTQDVHFHPVEPRSLRLTVTANF